MGDRKKRTHKDGRSKETNPQGWEKGVSERPPSFFFRYPLGGSPPSVRRAYDGYAASETEGSLGRFPKGRFLKMVFYATSTSTPTGALRRLPRGTQGKY